MKKPRPLQDPIKIEIRLLQDALNLVVQKYDRVRTSRGYDQALRYQDAGAVLQDMIEERRK